MRVFSPDAIKEKKNPYTKYYGYAIGIGIIAFLAILYAFKGFIWSIKLIFSHWLYVIVGIVILIGIKKFFGRKHMVVHRAKEDRDRY